MPSLLGGEMLEVLVVLRMNREFMEFMRRSTPKKSRKTLPFKLIVIAVEE